MRILMTADPELPVPPSLYGGIERIIDTLVQRLRARGHAVALLAHPDSTAQADESFPWPAHRSGAAPDIPRNAAALWKAARKFRPDVLHSFSRVLYMLPLLLRRSFPKVMSYQREPTHRTARWAARMAGRSLVFTGCAEHICERGRRGGGEWRTVHNFVDTGRYTFRPQVPGGAPLVFLSRIERIKGAHTAIAIARASGRRLIIAGNHADQGEGARYWRKEIEPHLGEGIQYIGPVNDEQKNELLGGAAAMVVPIEWEEPFGIVFAEALACGTPVISSPRGSLPEIVREGREGFLVRSVEEGVSAVARLDEIDRQDCRRRAEEAFSAEVIAERYEQLYCELTERCATAHV